MLVSPMCCTSLAVYLRLYALPINKITPNAMITPPAVSIPLSRRVPPGPTYSPAPLPFIADCIFCAESVLLGSVAASPFEAGGPSDSEDVTESVSLLLEGLLRLSAMFAAFCLALLMQSSRRLRRWSAVLEVRKDSAPAVFWVASVTRETASEFLVVKVASSFSFSL